MTFSRRKQFLFNADYFLNCLLKETEMRESGGGGVGVENESPILVLLWL